MNFPTMNLATIIQTLKNTTEINSQIEWCVDRMTVVRDEHDQFGYTFIARFSGKLPWPMKNAIIEWFRRYASSSHDSKHGMCYRVNFIENEKEEAMLYWGIDCIEIHYVTE